MLTNRNSNNNNSNNGLEDGQAGIVAANSSERHQHRHAENASAAAAALFSAHPLAQFQSQPFVFSNYASNMGRTNFGIHEILGLASTAATLPTIGNNSDAALAAAANCFGITTSAAYCATGTPDGSGNNTFLDQQQQHIGAAGTLNGQQINNLFTAGLELMPAVGIMQLPHEFATGIGDYPLVNPSANAENSEWNVRSICV